MVYSLTSTPVVILLHSPPQMNGHYSFIIFQYQLYPWGQPMCISRKKLEQGPTWPRLLADCIPNLLIIFSFSFPCLLHNHYQCPWLFPILNTPKHFCWKQCFSLHLQQSIFISIYMQTKWHMYQFGCRQCKMGVLYVLTNKHIYPVFCEGQVYT